MYLVSRFDSRPKNILNHRNNCDNEIYFLNSMSLEGCDVGSTMFWSHFNGKIGPEAKLPKPIMDAASFEETFDRGHDRWKGRQVVLFIDEFDKLHNEGAEHNREWMIATINSIRTQNKSAIRSIVIIGTFAILSPNQKIVFLSP